MKLEIIKDNRNQVNKAVNDAILRALEICGGMAESRAVDIFLSQVHSHGGLVETISHVVDKEEKKVYVGTTQKEPSPYGIYIEFGTGIYYKGGRRTSWVYKDKEGKWHKTNGMPAKPFIRPSIEENAELYNNVFKTELGEL